MLVMSLICRKHPTKEVFCMTLKPLPFILCLVSIFFAVGVSAQTLTVSADYLNVRKGPGLHYAPVRVVKKNQRFLILAAEKGWYNINVKGTLGWVSGKAVVVEEKGRGGATVDPKPAVKRTQGVGRSHALLFGTGHYDYWPDLPNPLLDVSTIADELEKNYGFQVETIESPTKREILTKLREYARKKYHHEDQLLIMFAGHGTFDGLSQIGYLVAKDSKDKQTDPNFESLLAYPILLRLIDKIPNRHILLIADACFAGTLDPRIATARSRGEDDMYADVTREEFVRRKIKFQTRRYVTSGGKEYVPDGRPGKHSPFARRLLEGLRGYGGRDGILTIEELLAVYLDKVKPQPRWNEFGDNEPGSSFLFIAGGDISAGIENERKIKEFVRRGDELKKKKEDPSPAMVWDGATWGGSLWQ